jgi:tRNA pseudouridine38-40 synthase
MFQFCPVDPACLVFLSLFFNPMARRWLKLTVAYDGTAYAGWQVQPNEPTVQAAIEAAWHAITREHVRVAAAGRTDAGVHALGQVVGLTTETKLSTADLRRGLNAMLPDDVAVVAVDDAREGFHATHDARRKTYRYEIHNGRTPDVFRRLFAWHFPQPLDAERMHTAGQLLVGKHDFASFESAGSDRPDTVRTLDRLCVARGTNESSDRITFEVTGDGFLYNMVRAIVGTLVEVGKGARDPCWVAEVLAVCDRRAAGQTAPPHGLFLVSVEY